MIPSTYKLSLPLLPASSVVKRPHREGVVVIAPSKTPRWAISIKKTAVPLAVNRNRLERQLNAALYAHRAHLPPQGIHVIIHRPPQNITAYIKYLLNLVRQPQYGH